MFSILSTVMVATVCGLIIGIERETKQKPAGIRSMLLITVGCSIYTAIAMDPVLGHSDPSRIIAQIVTGVGFLGGGAILKHEDRVVGITTAAFVWVASAIGILAGLGHCIEPIGLTVGLVIVSLVLERVEKLFPKSS